MIETYGKKVFNRWAKYFVKHQLTLGWVPKVSSFVNTFDWAKTKEGMPCWYSINVSLPPSLSGIEIDLSHTLILRDTLKEHKAAKKFIRNYRTRYNYASLAETLIINPQSVISEGFAWCGTKQGTIFWGEIDCEYIKALENKNQ